VLAALRDGAAARVAVRAVVVGTRVVGVGIAVDGALLALGVAPGHRRAGLGRALLDALGPDVASAEVTVAERDPFDPLDAGERIDVAARMLRAAGLTVDRESDEIGALDPVALVARR
jgi:GNAT superfamily N-acetyltransferase